MGEHWQVVRCRSLRSFDHAQFAMGETLAIGGLSWCNSSPGNLGHVERDFLKASLSGSPVQMPLIL